MRKNEISAMPLNGDAQSWIEKLRQVLLIQDKGKGTVKNYTAEMMLLFKYYNSKTVDSITATEIEQYCRFLTMSTHHSYSCGFFVTFGESSGLKDYHLA